MHFRFLRAAVVWAAFLLAFSLYSPYAHAQVKEVLQFHSGINQLVQDRDGYLFMGSWGELYRYDGYELQGWTRRDVRPLASAQVCALHTAADGRLWVGTDDDGLAVYDPATDDFTYHRADSRRPNALQVDRITAFAEDARGNLWIGTQGAGIAHLDVRQGRFSTYSMRMYGPEQEQFDDKVLALCLLPDGRLLFSSAEGFGLLDPVRRQMRHFSAPQAGYCRHICRMPDGSLWAAGDRGFFRLQLQDGKVMAQRIALGDAAGPVRMGRSRRLPQALWVASGRRLFCYDTQQGRLLEQQHYVDMAGNEQMLRPTSVFEDRQGNVWVSTTLGLNVYHAASNVFGHIRHPYMRAVNGLQTTDTHLWIGTGGYGLFSASKAAPHVASPVGALPPDAVVTDLAYWQGGLWVGTDGHGIYRLQPQSDGQARLQEHYELKGGKLPDDYLLCFLPSRQGKLWVGTWNQGLCAYDAAADAFVPALPELKGVPVVRMLEDVQGNLWLATRGAGIYAVQVYNGRALKVQHYPDLDAANPQARGRNINAMQWQDDAHLLVASEQGTYVMDIRDRRIAPAGWHKDLAMGQVRSLIKVEAGLWGSSYNSIFFMPRGGRQPSMSFFSEDGLQGSYNLSVAHQDAQGRLYFGGQRGVDFFQHRAIRPDTARQRVQLTAIRLFERPMAPGDVSQQAVPLPSRVEDLQDLTLPYDQNSLAFAFSALDMTAPGKVQYAYRLEGVDEDWVYRGAQERVAYYTDLGPGHYTLRIKATNSQGQWSDYERVLQVHITPPWWRTYWAWGFYLLLAAALLWKATRLFEQRLRRQNDMRLRYLEYQQMQEVYEMKIGFFTDMSHELRTPLSLIVAPLERLLAQTDMPEGARAQLQTMHKYTHRLLRVVNHLLDFRKLQAGKFALEEQAVVLRPFLDDIFSAFGGIAAQQGLHFSVQMQQLDPAMAMCMDAFRIESVLYNLLSNAFKYSEQGGSVRCEVQVLEAAQLPAALPVGKAERYLLLRVKDAGIGIPPDQLAYVFEPFYQVKGRLETGTGIGLALTRSIVELHHGHIAVESQEGLGTIFSCYLPIRLPAGSLPHARPTSLMAELAPAARPAQEPSAAEALVLVADDHPDIRQYLCSILQSRYRLLQAEDGGDAYAKVLKYQPDLVITDILMPEMDGRELCTRIKEGEQTAHIPVIVLTALSGEEERIRAIGCGADSFIPKPFNPEHLLLRVEKLLHARRTLKGSPQQQAPERQQGRPVRFEDRVNEAVNRRLSEPEYSIDQLADDLHMSRMQLYRRMKSEMGISANEYIRLLRLQKAAELMRRTELNISEIAYEVGFSDPQYFGKCFKKQYGQPPQEYRRALA